MTELRQRMIQDMQLHGFSPKTQRCYIGAVRSLAKHYDRSPDLLSEEDIRNFFLHLINKRQAARSTVTVHLSGIKFFFEKTLQQSWPVFRVVKPAKRKKLPVVLTPLESSHAFGAGPFAGPGDGSDLDLCLRPSPFRRDPYAKRRYRYQAHAGLGP